MKVAFFFEFTEVGIQLQCKGHVGLVLSVGPKTFLTEFGIHHSLESCANLNEKDF